MTKSTEAIRRTEEYIFSHKGRDQDQRFGVLNDLHGTSKSGNAPHAPYNLFNPKDFPPTKENWVLYELVEALQFRFEWEFIQPEDIDTADVATTLDLVGYGKENIFPGYNTTPAARRVILGIPLFHGRDDQDGWRIVLKRNHAFPVSMKHARKGVTAENELPPSVFFDESTQHWDVRPT